MQQKLTTLQRNYTPIKKKKKISALLCWPRPWRLKPWSAGSRARKGSGQWRKFRASESRGPSEAKGVGSATSWRSEDIPIHGAGSRPSHSCSYHLLMASVRGGTRRCRAGLTSWILQMKNKDKAQSVHCFVSGHTTSKQQNRDSNPSLLASKAHYAWHEATVIQANHTWVPAPSLQQMSHMRPATGSRSQCWVRISYLSSFLRNRDNCGIMVEHNVWANLRSG